MTIEASAAKAIAAALATALPELAALPVVIDAPPGLPVDYPACAVMVDTFRLYPSSDDDVYVAADGSAALGVAFPFGSGTPAKLDAGQPLFKAGSLRGAWRIWIASRTGPQRETMAERVMKVFFQDDMAPGRLLMLLEGLRVDGKRLPFAWPVAATLGKSSWNNELAFSDRRWIYLDINVDVDILLTRNIATVTDLRLVLQSTDYPEETYQINSDGTASQI